MPTPFVSAGKQHALGQQRRSPATLTSSGAPKHQANPKADPASTRLPPAPATRAATATAASTTGAGTILGLVHAQSATAQVAADTASASSATVGFGRRLQLVDGLICGLLDSPPSTRAPESVLPQHHGGPPMPKGGVD
jgi:hypothetical protein